MKALITVLSLVFCFNVYADSAKTAQSEYDKRDYTEAGQEHVKKAISIYRTLVATTADPVMKRNYQIRQSQALYFLGTAAETKKDKMDTHLEGYELGKAVIAGMGIQQAHKLSEAEIEKLTQTKSEQELESLAYSFYFTGINLAKWGQAKGVSAAIGRLSEVMGLIENITGLGYAHIEQYGPNRTIGRILYTIPSLLGGDLDESEALLEEAVYSSLVDGEDYSMSATNSLYYAETLYSNGSKDQAKEVIAVLIKADINLMEPSLYPENKSALKQAQALATKWQVQ